MNKIPIWNRIVVKMTGIRREDFKEANRQFGIPGANPPTGYTWHHVDDFNSVDKTCTMQLVKKMLIEQLTHTRALAGSLMIILRRIYIINLKGEKMENLIKDSWAKIADDDIKETERILNIKIPKEIRFFYLKYNGGQPERDVFYSEGYEYMVNVFYPLILKNMEDSVVKVYQELKEVLPSWFVVIGDDGGDGLYGFSIKEKELGAIYYWEGDYDYGENPDEHVVYLSESIESFLEDMVKD